MLLRPRHALALTIMVFGLAACMEDGIHVCKKNQELGYGCGKSSLVNDVRDTLAEITELSGFYFKRHFSNDKSVIYTFRERQQTDTCATAPPLSPSQAALTKPLLTPSRTDREALRPSEDSTT